jgi:nicotinate-nucleotide adenylyltransferase
MKVMLFGGSFNPPHLGHQQMAKAVLKAALADQLWYLPVGKHDFAKEVVSAEQRLEMLKLILPKIGEAFFGQMRIEDCEIRYFETSYTATTLDYLSARYPEHQFSFLMGSDNLVKFHLWYDQLGRNYQYLLDHYPIYVYPRVNFPLKPLYKNMIPLFDLQAVEASSTQVREALSNEANKTDLKKLLDERIINYIRKQQLYATS